jgi:cytochrome d ubiquinol oxidase subunit II
MIMLWLLILRGTSIEFRNHLISRVWDPFWDFLFRLKLASRHFPWRPSGQRRARRSARCPRVFLRAPLDELSARGQQTGILDWCTILVGVLSLFVLVMHGTLWVQMKTTDAVNQRSGKLAATAWWGVLILTAVVTTITFKIQPQVQENFVTGPWASNW